MLRNMTTTASPYRIIAVCTGNICRSPMAQLMLTEALAATELANTVTIDSAGTTAYEVGNPIDPRAARKLAAHNILSEHHIAREWRPEWFQERQLILALDVDHYDWLREAAPDGESRSKVRMLRSFDPEAAGRDPMEQGIEDPWFGGSTEFDTTWEQIRAAVPGMIEFLRSAVAESSPLKEQKQQQVRSIP